jgi:hypothetical protein
MSGRHFDSSENAELRAKIDDAKRLLPMPQLLEKLELGAHAKKSARCLWHKDEHPSFSVFQKSDGTWWHRCFAGCSQGDEIAFLVKHFNISRREAIRCYLDKAGFPARVPRKSHECLKSREYPKCPESLSVCVSSVSESPCVSVYPVSEGQGLEKELRELAAKNACICASDKAGRKRFKLARNVRAVEKRIERTLSTAEIKVTLAQWYRLSRPFLPAGETFDDDLTAFLAELEKVRVPTGEGDTLNKAIATVAKLSPDELPAIPGYVNAPANARRLLALHRELSRLSVNSTHFLSYRDAAKVCDGLSQQQAHTMTLALVRLGVIEIIRKGKAGLNSGKAAEFRYLLPHDECPDDDEIPV